MIQTIFFLTVGSTEGISVTETTIHDHTDVYIPVIQLMKAILEQAIEHHHYPQANLEHETDKVLNCTINLVNKKLEDISDQDISHPEITVARLLTECLYGNKFLLSFANLK